MHGESWFDAGAGVVVGYPTLGGTCEAGVTQCDQVANPVQSAIDDVRSTGKDIFISGYYSEQITISKNLNLISYGTGGLISPTTLNLSFTDANGIGVYSLITINNNADVLISGLEIKGNGASVSGVGDAIFSGITFNNATGVLVNLEIQDFVDPQANQTGVGIYVYNSDNVTVLNSKVADNEIGISVQSSNNLKLPVTISPQMKLV